VVRLGAVGAFFTNVQVRSADPQVVQRIAEALRAQAREAGLVAAAEGETSDRGVVIAPPQGGWIAIYDEATETQEPARLEALAQLAARASGGHAVEVLVHDSDVLSLRLHDASGALVDELNSHPSYFGDLDEAQQHAVRGVAERWVPVIAAGRTAADLERAWRGEPVFAEQLLRAIAPVLGMDVGRVAMGYRYADGDAPAESIVLRFRHAQRPGWQLPASGPPQLVASGISPHVELFADAPMQLVASARNSGGEARGIVVVVGGSAVAEGLVAIDEGELVLGAAPGSRDEGLTRVPLQFRDVPGDRGAAMRAARASEAILQAGPAVPLEEAMAQDPNAFRTLLGTGTVHLNVTGRAVRAGRGEVSIAIIPVEHPQAAYVKLIQLDVRAATRRPLHAKPALPPQLLEPLESRESLFGLITVDVADAEAVAIARDAFARWSPILPAGAEVTVIHGDRGRRPTVRKRRDDERFDRELATEHQVGLLAMEGLQARRMVTHGIVFGRTLEALYRRSDADPELATLGLWSPREDEKTRQLAIEIAEHAFVRGRGTQAMVARWGWSPINLHGTPYETACDVRGGLQTRSYQTSCVRGVAEGVLWLGPALLARIDRGALEAVADVRELVHGVRVEVRDVTAVERALEPVLPRAAGTAT
jgi:hypothetical protein